MFKVIFLDVDGVLNDWHTTDSCAGYIGVDDDKIELLKQIIDATGAKIVLSSSWRVSMTRTNERRTELRGYLDKKLADHGLEVYSETPLYNPDDTYEREHRGWEIKQWRDQHKNIDWWIVLDDEIFRDFYDYGVTEHLVLTNEWEGLTQRGVDRAIWMLENKQPYAYKVVEDEI